MIFAFGIFDLVRLCVVGFAFLCTFPTYHLVDFAVTVFVHEVTLAEQTFYELCCAE